MDFSAQQKLTRKITETMFATLTKGQELPDVKITPEVFAEAVTAQVAGMDGVEDSALAQIKNALQALGEQLAGASETEKDEAAGTQQ